MFEAVRELVGIVPAGPGQHDRQHAVRLSEHSSMTSIMSISRPVLDAQRTQHSKHHEDQAGIALLSALLPRSMMSVSWPFHYQLPQTREHQQYQLATRARAPLRGTS